jgi:hypothetical protein
MTRTVSSSMPDREKLPSASVIVPVEVPFMFTLTPGRGRRSEASLTVPVMVLSWAKTDEDNNIKGKRKKPIELILLFRLFIELGLSLVV